ncbi:hypothetical protein B0T11DRAFT_276018 [Plectosphaerella cucumerina]|uniref:Uncharacterized protein n=1 Tax=Plectosphaerella cucumerina TaxID=40658 RepID=A0A8K0TMB8_9PEZI|nr:hypothetical protein B0T11DRAFT_276018 [Plectosphaerella cucumerina]
MLVSFLCRAPIAVEHTSHPTRPCWSVACLIQRVGHLVKGVQHRDLQAPSIELLCGSVRVPLVAHILDGASTRSTKDVRAAYSSAQIPASSVIFWQPPSRLFKRHIAGHPEVCTKTPGRCEHQTVRRRNLATLEVMRESSGRFATLPRYPRACRRQSVRRRRLRRISGKTNCNLLHRWQLHKRVEPQTCCPDASDTDGRRS